MRKRKACALTSFAVKPKDMVVRDSVWQCKQTSSSGCHPQTWLVDCHKSHKTIFIACSTHKNTLLKDGDRNIVYNKLIYTQPKVYYLYLILNILGVRLLRSLRVCVANCLRVHTCERSTAHALVTRG